MEKEIGRSLRINIGKTNKFVPRRDSKDFVVVKGSVPRALKRQFKLLCVQNDLKMSEALETLIEQWLRVDAPFPEVPTDFSNEEYEDVKGYIPKSLKHEFKVMCTQKNVKIRSILHQIIKDWINQNSLIRKF